MYHIISIKKIIYYFNAKNGIYCHFSQKKTKVNFFRMKMQYENEYKIYLKYIILSCESKLNHFYKRSKSSVYLITGCVFYILYNKLLIKCLIE